MCRIKVCGYAGKLKLEHRYRYSVQVGRLNVYLTEMLSLARKQKTQAQEFEKKPNTVDNWDRDIQDHDLRLAAAEFGEFIPSIHGK